LKRVIEHGPEKGVKEEHPHLFITVLKLTASSLLLLSSPQCLKKALNESTVKGQFPLKCPTCSKEIEPAPVKILSSLLIHWEE
jgi:hypothetical protein